MQYDNKLPDDAVNLGKKGFLKETLWMLGIVFILILGGYIGTGMAVDWAVEKVSPETERRIWESVPIEVEKVFPVLKNPSPETLSQEKLLQTMADDLLKHSRLKGFPIKIRLVEEYVVNAGALPDGHILIFRGLLEHVSSENELRMVIGHEIGHLSRRHHLESMGRKLVLAIITTSLFGDTNLTSSFFSGALEIADLEFTRDNEIESDEVGLALLMAHYGHAGGATDFFEEMARRHKSPNWVALFRTHPHGKDRAAHLKKLIKRNNYPVKALKGVPEAFGQNNDHDLP